MSALEKGYIWETSYCEHCRWSEQHNVVYGLINSYFQKIIVAENEERPRNEGGLRLNAQVIKWVIWAPLFYLKVHTIKSRIASNNEIQGVCARDKALSL